MSLRRNLVGVARDELTRLCELHGLPPFRATQLWQWMYSRGVTSFSDMTNISRDIRNELQDHYVVHWGLQHGRTVAQDGTIKFMSRFQDDREAETVFIPETARGTVCVSSQVGCSLQCSFCHTGTQVLQRNLTAGEIVGQVLRVRSEVGDFGKQTNERRVTNVVFMGQGEPLYNYRNVRAAVEILTSQDGLALSRRKITVSTSGVAPLIPKVGNELGVVLALSLHAPTDDLRNELVPLNRTYDLKTVMAAVREHPRNRSIGRITMQYVMIDGVNDSDACATDVARLLRGVHCIVNLIPFNPWPGSPYRTSPPERIEAFARRLDALDQMVTVRRTRGDDILAACGQLKTHLSQAPKAKRKRQAIALRVFGAGGYGSRAAMDFVKFQPPPNFGFVEEGLYRCGQPSIVHFPFLETLNLRIIIFLAPDPPSEELEHFVAENGIKLVQVENKGSTSGIRSLSEQAVLRALDRILTRSAYPLCIMCNLGRHRTGVVVGCLRKLQRWNLASIFEEYARYAGTKRRRANEQFIEFFDTDLVPTPEDPPPWFQVR